MPTKRKSGSTTPRYTGSLAALTGANNAIQQPKKPTYTPPKPTPQPVRQKGRGGGGAAPKGWEPAEPAQPPTIQPLVRYASAGAQGRVNDVGPVAAPTGWGGVSGSAGKTKTAPAFNPRTGQRSNEKLPQIDFLGAISNAFGSQLANSFNPRTGQRTKNGQVVNPAGQPYQPYRGRNKANQQPTASGQTRSLRPDYPLTKLTGGSTTGSAYTQGKVTPTVNTPEYSKTVVERYQDWLNSEQNQALGYYSYLFPRPQAQTAQPVSSGYGGYSGYGYGGYGRGGGGGYGGYGGGSDYEAWLKSLLTRWNV